MLDSLLLNEPEIYAKAVKIEEYGYAVAKVLTSDKKLYIFNLHGMWRRCYTSAVYETPRDLFMNASAYMLKAFAEDSGVYQKDISDATEIPESTVSYYLRAKAEPTFTNLVVICKYLNLSLSVFESLYDDALYIFNDS